MFFVIVGRYLFDFFVAIIIFAAASLSYTDIMK